MECLYDFGGLCARERVVDSLALTPGANQAILAEQRQLLRDSCLPCLDEASEFADRPLALQKVAEEEKAVPTGKRLQEVCRLLYRLEHLFYLHSFIHMKGIGSHQGCLVGDWAQAWRSSSAAGGSATL